MRTRTYWIIAAGSLIGAAMTQPACAQRGTYRVAFDSTKGAFVASSSKRARKYYKASKACHANVDVKVRVYFKSEKDAQAQGYVRSEAQGC